MNKSLPFLLGMIVVWATCLSMPGKDQPPNVIIVLTDDNGLGDFSYTGNPFLKTPHLDRWAKESVRFTDFHVAPMCSPTRGQLMSGLHALRNGVTSVTAGRTFLRKDLTTLPQLFAAAGYQTGLFGKWHLGDHYPHRPHDKGFHEAVYHLGWGMLNATPEIDNPLVDGRYFHNGVAKKFTGHCTDFWFDSAQRWMLTQKENHKPFFCYIPTNAAHTPHIDDPKYSKPYQRDKLPADFYGMIAHVDERAGMLEQFLIKHELKDNTILIFMTDNGGTAGVKTFNAGMRGHKTEYYEGGHRVPLWIRWPNAPWKGNRDISIPTQVQDILPTLLELCPLQKQEQDSNKPAPRYWELREVDQRYFAGRSLAPLLRNEYQQFPSRLLVVQYGQTPKKGQCCIIWNQWRLVGGEELYHIGRDPAQTKNVALTQPNEVKIMRAYYENWWHEAEKYCEQFVPNTIGSTEQPEVKLTSADWENIYADNIGHVCKAVGGPRGGSWHLEVASSGTYEFELRRWPDTVETPFNALFEQKYPNHQFPKLVKVRFPNITKGTVEFTGKEALFQAHANCRPSDSKVTVRLTLEKGIYQMKAWLSSAQEDCCGAFFVKVRKSQDKPRK